MEMVSGVAYVSINGEKEKTYQEGQQWEVGAGGYFVIRALEPVHYICHFE